MDKDISTEAILLLDDGSIYIGKSAGVKGTTSGEICFNTAMTGYQEIFTDPSYFGQILVSTNVHVGNYGIKTTDVESDRIQISGLICKNFTNDYSRPMADEAIQDYFETNKLVCIYDIDTREIVKKIRDKGAMNCIISSDIKNIEQLRKLLNDVPSMEGLELASKVTTSEAYTMGEPDALYRIAVLDFGTKKNIVRNLVDRGTYVKVFPAKTDVEELNSFRPDAYFLSNGPGDPASMDYAIQTVRKLVQLSKPIFGICLGHQILALAIGIGTYKMHHGHRGANHPVLNLLNSKCEITSQNHGFSVVESDIEALKDRIEITHINLNDHTIEGIRIKGQPIASVQYHPESNPGPHDSRYLFDDFIKQIKQNKNN